MLYELPIENIKKSVDQKSVVARTRASRTTCHSWCWGPGGHRKLLNESLRCWKTEGKRWWKLCVGFCRLIWLEKQSHVRLYDWDYVEKNPMFSSFSASNYDWKTMGLSHWDQGQRCWWGDRGRTRQFFMMVLSWTQQSWHENCGWKIWNCTFFFLPILP